MQRRHSPSDLCPDRRKLLLGCMAGSLSTTLPLSGAAQSPFPSKVIRIVVQAAAGGQTDIMARLVGQRLSERLGAPVIVDNRPGAGGTIAMEFVARSPADGYTLGTAAMNTHGAASGLYPNLKYDPVADFAPVVYAVSTVSVLSVYPGLPVRSLQELIALAKAQPGKLTYASGGSGTSNHLFMELLKRETRIDIVHVPYKGSAPALVDVLGGQVPLIFDPLPASIGYIRDGRLRPLAVSSGKRSPVLPDVPTVGESGVPGYDHLSWLSFVAPAGTPADVIAKLNGTINEILKEPSVRATLSGQGMEPVGGTPEQLGAHIKAQVKTWTEIIRASGAKPG
ncbi:MAG: Bug family tripartite tricarboxylate transporter substrate binding protein [Lautropia sp.]